MPYNRFICPDGNECEIKDCMNGCRIKESFRAGRCLSLPTLKAASEQRTWTGVPSTTQLLNGTRESYLKITEEYAINPEQRIWAIFGTAVHSVTDSYCPDDHLGEIRIFDENSSGAFDYYDASSGDLYDRKTYGSYKTAKLMGLTKVRYPVFGEDGKQLKHKNGKPMFEDCFEIGAKDRLDVAVQMNDYRMKLEMSGFPVNNMFVEVLVRDGGTYIAKNRGIDFNARLVEINKVSDRWISRYMGRKARDLAYYLEQQTLPPPCKMRETWGGIKCERYCDVWKFCDVGQKLHKTTAEDAA